MSTQQNQLKYVSIDVETTGADRDNDDMIELTAKIDDLSALKPIDELPRFHCYVVKERYSGCSWAFSRHAEIFKAIEECGEECISEQNVAHALFNFIDENNGYIEMVDKDLYNNTCGRIILPAGKNFSSFDLHFLYRLPGFKGLLGFPTRAIDVGNMYLLPTDIKPPSLTECAKRAGLDMEVNHRSDNEVDMVIHCVRHFLKLGKEKYQKAY